MSLEKHEHRWTKLEDREKVTKLNKSTPRSKALMPNGEKSHHLDLSKIKGKKFGVGTFHK